MSKTILITGSSGFIGKNLINFLQNEYNLLIPRIFELDLIDKPKVIEFFNQNIKIDYIIHCATIGGSRGINDPETTINDNIKMVENLLSAKNLKTKLILFSSGAMYNKYRDLKKVKEEELGICIPDDLYGKSKMIIAQKIKNREDVICLNIFACYGYGEKNNRFPTYAIMENLKKRDIIINQNVIFDYLFIEDLQKIIKYFLENDTKDNIMNITPTQSISLVEIAEIVNQISDYKSNIIVKNSTLNFEYTGSNKILLNNYPDLSFTSYEDGIKKLFFYYKDKISDI